MLQKEVRITSLKKAIENNIACGNIEKVDPPLDHYFADGLYGRRIYVPAGTTVITKIHLKQHITIALKGTCTVVDESGNKKEITAPSVFITEPGTQRAVYCHDDVEWITVHASDEKEVEEVERILVCETFDEYNIRMLERKKLWHLQQ